MPRLSEFSEAAHLDVVRDADFEHLGFLKSQLDNLVTVVSRERLLAQLDSERFVAVITTPELAKRIPEHLGVATSEAPMDGFYRLHIAYDAPERYSGHRGATHIDPSAQVHPTAYVAEQDVWIGARTIVGPNANVLERAVIGEDCVLHPGTVITSEGYQVYDLDGKRMIVPHKGGTRLGDRVELQSNTIICRSMLGGFTTIGDDTKTDTLCHVAHECHVGARVRMAGSAVIAGSTTIADDVWVGPQTMISSGIGLTLPV